MQGKNKGLKAWLLAAVQAVLRWLMPKNHHFFDYLEAQANIARQAAEKLKGLSTEKLTDVADALQQLEHQGDAEVRKLEEALADTFVTPLDREDLQRLSSELDDVLDFANSAARACWMRGVDRPTVPMQRMIGVLAEMTQLLCQAVGLLRKSGYVQITALARDVRKLESSGDAYYREAIYALYHDDTVDAKRLRREEKVLGDLEDALNVAEDLADSLAYMAVKHG